ncbi:MAG: tetratricopeptide repeat protein [Bacteroidia bacterium]
MRRTDIDRCNELAKEALDASISIDYEEGMAYCYRTLGVSGFYQMKYQRALPDLYKAKAIFLEKGNLRATSSCYRNIGNIYTQIGVLEKARLNYERAIEFAEKVKDTRSIMYVKVNLGLVQQLKGNSREAIRILTECLSVLEQFQDKHAISETLFNIGNNYLQLEDFENSELFLRKALSASSEIEYLKGISQTLTILGSLYFKKKETEKALAYMHEGLATALELNEKRIASETYKTLAEAYKTAGNLAKALECFEQYDEMRAKLSAHDNRSLVESLQSEIESEKSERMIVESKNREIEYAYELIKEKNKDITDSLKYAKHIQHALLPDIKFISGFIKDFFIFYQSKEIVSGDLYWFQEKEGKIYIAACDCTGHGVPGAFISIVSNNCLYQATREIREPNAALILDRVNELFNQSIKQHYEDSTVRDGMDVSLCIFDFVKNTISFAGANHNLYLVRNGEMKEISGNKQPIGVFIGHATRNFEEQQVNFQKGDSIYMFTDGYADQFGGETGDKKYMRKRFKNYLTAISGNESAEQQQLLKKDFNNWKGNNEQVDDVLVIGMRV